MRTVTKKPDTENTVTTRLGIVLSRNNTPNTFEFYFQVQTGTTVDLNNFVSIVRPQGDIFGKIDSIIATSELFSNPKLLEFYHSMDKRIDDYFQNDMYQIAHVNVLGTITSTGITLANNPAQPGEQIFKATSAHIQKYLKLNTAGLFLGQLAGQKDITIAINPEKLFPYHFAVLGATGSGKSYTNGVIIEEALLRKLPVVIIDPHGEYAEMLTGIQDRLNITADTTFTKTIFRIPHRPYEQTLHSPLLNTPDPTIIEVPITISLQELSPDYLAELLGCTDVQADLLSIAILDYQNTTPAPTSVSAPASIPTIIMNDDFSIDNLINKVEETGKRYGFASNTIKAVQRRTYRLKSLNVLGKSIDIRSLVPAEGITIIDLSDAYDEYTQRILAAVCLTKIFQAARDGMLAPLLLVIEEGHIFASQYEDSASKWILRKISREGRKFGLGLNITSQRIIGLDKDILSQCNTKVILKIDSKTDLEYLVPYLALTSQSEINMIPILPQGHALLAGLAIGSPAVIKVRERYTQHGGQTPIFITNTATTSTQQEPLDKPERERDTVERVNRSIPPGKQPVTPQPKKTILQTLSEEVDITDIVDKLVLSEQVEEENKELHVTTTNSTKSVSSGNNNSTSSTSSSSTNPTTKSGRSLTANILEAPSDAGSGGDKKQGNNPNLEDKSVRIQNIASLIVQNFQGKTGIFTTIFMKLQEIDTTIDRESVNMALEQLEKEKKIVKESKISKEGRPYILLKF